MKHHRHTFSRPPPVPLAKDHQRWIQNVSEQDEVSPDLLDVNSNFFEEVERHSKAMAAIYIRHTDTSSSSNQSGTSTPIELGTPDDLSEEPSELGDGRGAFGDGGNSDIGGDERDEVIQQIRFEQSIFLKAALTLLLEKTAAEDLAQKQMEEAASGHQSFHGVGGGANLIKSGYLKKANHHSMGTMWKTKLVEIHQGVFIYEDDDSLLGKRKKSIRLTRKTCICRSIMSKKNNVFELSVKSGAKRLWMASNEEDKQEWLKAIQDAVMVETRGGDNNGAELFADSPYANDIDRYTKIKNCFECSPDKVSYLLTVEELREEQICVPLAWIKMQTGDELMLDSPLSRGVGFDLVQLWKDMRRDIVSINGQDLYGESGPESIVGALARAIMNKARSAKHKLGGGHSKYSSSTTELWHMNEVQALTYTKDILLACNRTQSGGDTYYCVEYLFRNPSLVVLCPFSSHAEPLKITVQLAEEPVEAVTSAIEALAATEEKESVITPESSLSFQERARKTQSVKVPKGGNPFAQTLPRPSSMKNIAGAVGLINFELPIAQGAESRRFSRTAPLKLGIETPSPVTSPMSGKNGSSCDELTEKSYGGGGLGKTSGIKPPTPTTRSVISVKIEANTAYKICPTDPQDDNDDIWSIVSAKFEKQFSISANGLLRGNELVSLTTINPRNPEREKP